MNKRIYWRVRRDVRDGSVTWETGWLVRFPADGLIEISDRDDGLRGKVFSVNEIEYRVAT